MIADRPVAIVGGGFSGLMTAAQLARRGVTSLLFDGSGRIGRGVAYSTTEAAHLLNVPSGKMSAWPDRPDDFARFAQDDGTGFAQRRLYGRYLGEILDSAPGVVRIEVAVVGAVPGEGGWRLSLADGTTVEAAALVLATGNEAPAPFARFAEVAGFVSNPWSSEAHAAVARVAAEGSGILLIGTGLTAIDTMLSLAAAGHRGTITALSRRGLVPRAHASFEPAPVPLDAVPLGQLVALWRWVRNRSAEVGFRAAVDSLRPHSHAIWQALSPSAQRRFLRHARPWWDVHRHRIAPQVSHQLQEMIAAGQLEIVAGRLAGLEPDGDGMMATIDRRRGQRTERRVGAAINCTGPLGEIGRTRDPLLRQLLDEGHVCEDQLGIGLVLEPGSRAGNRIWALGPLAKGRYWEITAVPDIRGQAAEVADDVAGVIAG